MGCARSVYGVRSLHGIQWNQRSHFWPTIATQQKQITDQFRQLLIYTYSGALSEVRDQQVQYKPFRDDPADTVAQEAGETIASLKGRHAWTTEEGTVIVEAQGDTVMVSEGLDAATTTTLEKEVFASPSPSN